MSDGDVYSGAAGDWSVAALRPPADLAELVESIWETRGTVGYSMEKLVPSARAVFMINLGPPHRVAAKSRVGHGDRFSHAWIAGQQEHPIYTSPILESGPLFETHFLIVSLTPIGLLSLFGIAAHELTNRIVEAEDIFGSAIGVLRDRIGEVPDRHARFEALIAFLRSQRMARARPASFAAIWAVGRTLSRRGDTRVAHLCDELGVSRKHLNTLYRETVGLSPKSFARLTRFNAVLAAIESGERANWVDRAIANGYFDQAHMHRDFAQYTHESPGDFLKVRSLDGNGVVYGAEGQPLR